MHLIFHLIEKNKRIKLELNSKQKIKEIKCLLSRLFELESILLTNKFNLFLKLHGSELNDNWSIQHIPSGSTIKCYVDYIKITDYYVYILFQKKIIELINTKFDPKNTFIIQLRVYLSELLGLPLSVFRLKSYTNSVMFDQYLIDDYKMTRNSQFILETWHGWDLFLENCIKGFTKKILQQFSSDELIRQYQIKVALYIGAYYDNYDLVNKMIKLGAKPDEPVGMHPCQMWSQQMITYPDKLPLHIAAQNGYFKLILLMIKNRVHILAKKDQNGLPLWRLILKYSNKITQAEITKRKEIAKFLLVKQASLKFKLNDDFKITLNLYSKLKYWMESAQEKVYKIYGYKYTSLKKRPFYKSSLLGPRVLVDGYNNDFNELRISFNLNKFGKLPQIKRTNSFTQMTHSSYISFDNTNKSFLDTNRTDHKNINQTNCKLTKSYKNKRTNLKSDTLKLFEKYNHGHTVNETAKHYLDEADRFKSKSWLQKIQMSSRMAQANVIERLRNSNTF